MFLARFYRYDIQDNIQAIQCFKQSVQHKENLPAYLEIAELAAEDRNYTLASAMLEEGLALVLNPMEAREKEKLMARVNELLVKVENFDRARQ